MKKVMVFGTFDVLHPGHQYLLKKSKELGDELVVVVARDTTVVKVKGRKPSFPEEIRKNNLEKLRIANKVILGETGNKLQVIINENPDIIALGYDQTHFVEELTEKFKDKILIVKIDSFRPDIYKSSKFKKDIE